MKVKVTPGGKLLGRKNHFPPRTFQAITPIKAHVIFHFVTKNPLLDLLTQ